MAATNDFDDSMMDDLFEYDIDDRDLGELDITIPDLPPAPSQTKKGKDDLGLDKEVEVKQKRVVVKLDEQRLLSSNGLPKLRKEAPRKLKFKGKGHEYKDASRLLSYYQLWADDLFKKAKFRHTLAIIEKLGHTRGVRNVREEWIQEIRSERQDRDQMKGLHKNAEGGETSGHRTGEPNEDQSNWPNDDDMYSLPTGRPAPRPAAPPQDPNALFLGGAPDSDEEMEAFDDEDIVAALLKEKEQAAQNKAPGREPERDEFDEFDDDMEAMEAMAAVERSTALPKTADPPANAAALAPPPPEEEFEFDDDEEAMEAMMAMGEVDSSAKEKAPASRAPPRDEFEDELEAMEAMGGM